jgi:hypothetical protein
MGQAKKGQTLLGVGTTFNVVSLDMIPSSNSSLFSGGVTTFNYKDDNNNTDSEPNKTTNINLLPKIGYFVKDNLAIGGDLHFGYSHSKNESGEYSSENNLTIFGIGPFIRHYFPAEKTMPYFEVGGLLGSYTNNYKYSYSNNSEESKNKARTYGFNAGLGVAFLVGTRATIDGLIGYSSMTIKEKDENPDNERMVLGFWGIKVGFNVFLTGKTVKK